MSYRYSNVVCPMWPQKFKCPLQIDLSHLYTGNYLDNKPTYLIHLSIEFVSQLLQCYLGISVIDEERVLNFELLK